MVSRRHQTTLQHGGVVGGGCEKVGIQRSLQEASMRFEMTNWAKELHEPWLHPSSAMAQKQLDKKSLVCSLTSVILSWV